MFFSFLFRIGRLLIPLVLLYAGECRSGSSNNQLRRADYWSTLVHEVPSKLPAKKLIVYLHGTCGNINEFTKDSVAFQCIQDALPDCHFMVPNGSEAYDGALRLGNPCADIQDPSKRQWVSLKGLRPLIKDIASRRWYNMLEDQIISPEEFAKGPSSLSELGGGYISLTELSDIRNKHDLPLKQMSSLLESNVQRLMKKIEQQQEKLGLTNEDTVIIGFSQGAMLGLYLTLRQTKPFLGMISFAGILVEPSSQLIENPTTPICLIHGRYDGLIPFKAMELTALDLAKHAIKPTVHLCPLSGHVDLLQDPKALQHAINFINSPTTSHLSIDDHKGLRRGMNGIEHPNAYKRQKVY